MTTKIKSSNLSSPIDIVGDLTIAGNVGIGTSSPVQALDVVGEIKNSFGILFSPRNTIYLTTGTEATYTPTVGTKVLKVTVVGGGGGGIDGDASGSGAAGGGGGGAVVYKLITSVATSYTYTIGAGGNGGPAGINDGTTTFTDGLSITLTAGGGIYGVGSSATAGNRAGAGAAGGTASGGDINVNGLPSTARIVASGSLACVSNGGSSAFGAGGRGLVVSSGEDATGNGAGGGGASVNSSTSANYAGGSGSGGIIIIEEFARD